MPIVLLAAYAKLNEGGLKINKFYSFTPVLHLALRAAHPENEQVALLLPFASRDLM